MPDQQNWGLGSFQSKWLRKGAIFVSAPWLSADNIAAHLGIAMDAVNDSIFEKHVPSHGVGRLWKSQGREVDDRTPRRLRGNDGRGRGGVTAPWPRVTGGP